MDDRRSSSYRRTSWNVGLGGADVPSIDPGTRRPYGGRQDRGRCRVGRVRVHQRRVRRCPSGIPGARYRHREAVRRAAGPRAAPRPRRRRAGGALQRWPLRARCGAMARTNPRCGPSPGGRRWNRVVRTRAGGGPVPRAPARPGAMRPWYIQLTLPRDVLHRRIAQRVDEMLTGGLVDELRRILATGVAPHAPGLDGVGYREVAAMLAGRLPERDLREAIVVATRRYAKRQETWFRHQLRDAGSGKGETGNVWTLDATASPDALATRILERWRSATAPGSLLPAPER